jgi:hypothetical protein
MLSSRVGENVHSRDASEQGLLPVDEEIQSSRDLEVEICKSNPDDVYI